MIKLHIFKLKGRIFKLMSTSYYSHYSPLSPIAIHAIAAFVVESRFSLTHRSLIFLHFNPGTTGRIEGTPNGNQCDEHQRPVAYDDG